MVLEILKLVVGKKKLNCFKAPATEGGKKRIIIYVSQFKLKQAPSVLENSFVYRAINVVPAHLGHVNRANC